MKAGTRDAQKNLLDKTLAEEQSKSCSMEDRRHTPPCDWPGPVKNYFLLPFLSLFTTSADIANK